MMPITPSGIRMRAISSPFGRTRLGPRLPTGSGSSATSRSPRAMAAMVLVRDGEAVDQGGREARAPGGLHVR